ncbi:MAG TPA: MATE family efflux transporter [Dehalococcoidales bacterium]|nr:MATE family efflux transporter [Dehalococcoidales bacterium]
MPNIQQQNHNVLDTDEVGRLLVKLATPAFLGMFVQTLYNVVNTIFVGQFVGTLAIAGLSVVFPLQMLSWGISMMVGMGGASLLSRLLGVRDVARAERVLGNGVTISLILSAVVMVAILPFVDFWLRLIGASDAVLPFAREYLIIIISGAVFNILAMAFLSFARAEGNARVGMTAMILGAVLSIILDAIFIIWLKMGVRGAAFATIISQIAAFIYLLSYYLTGSSYLKIRMTNLRLDFSILKAMFSIGVASFVQTIAGSLSAMILIKMVVTYGGDIALGAFGIVQRIMMFALMPGMVLGQGSQPILGFNYGARRYHRVLKTIMIAIIASTSLSMMAFLVLYFLPHPIISVFTKDTQLIDMGAYASRLIFLSLPLIGFIMVGQLIFQAIGKALQAFIAAIVRPVVFLIPAVLVLSRVWQLDGVFLAFPVSDLLTFLLIIALLAPVINQFRKAAAAEKLETTGPAPAGPLPDTRESGRVID